MPSSRLWRAITFIHGLCVTALDEYANPDDPKEAYLEDSLAHELKLLAGLSRLYFGSVGCFKTLPIVP